MNKSKVTEKNGTQESSLRGSKLSKLQMHIELEDKEMLRKSFQGFGITTNQSASTLQKSVPIISFTKSKRFLDLNQENDAPLMMFNSTLTNRGTSFGYGKKTLQSLEELKKAQINPGPDQYMSSKFKINFNQGKSFGLGHEFYKKQLMPNINPGPGEYIVNKKFGTDRPIVQMKGQKLINQNSQQNPGPSHYVINHKSILSNKYSQIYMRQSLKNNSIEDITPGPSCYNNIDVHKNFDKHKKNNRFLKNFVALKQSQKNIISYNI